MCLVVVGGINFIDRMESVYGAKVLEELEMGFVNSLETLKREQDIAIREVDGNRAQEIALVSLTIQYILKSLTNA